MKKKYIFIFILTWIITFLFMTGALHFIFLNFVDSATPPTNHLMVFMGKTMDFILYILFLPSSIFVFLRLIPNPSYAADLGLEHWFIVYAGIDAFFMTLLIIFFENRKNKSAA